MNFGAAVELVKYTLALAAACLAYSIEKLVPVPAGTSKWFVLLILMLLFISTLAGILVFSAATAALHRKPGQTGFQEMLMEKAAYVHVPSLMVGVCLLGVSIVVTVLTT